MSNTHLELAALRAFIAEHPQITCTEPTSPNYPALRQIYARDQKAIPLAIVRPQSTADVSLLIKFVVSNSIKFTIRTGGHNLWGAAVAQDALIIDMRDIKYATISADKKTATIGGGILTSDLVAALEKEGLATPIGFAGSVGYVGWATYGGYGPFSRHWGLGVDQILGAKIVNADGEVVVANERLLKGLKGGGGLFGVIVELEIRVYPLKNILAGILFLESSDIASTLKKFNAGYLDLSAKEMPSELVVQQIIINTPQGRAMGVAFMWSSEDVEAGRVWVKKIEALSTVVMNTVAVTTFTAYVQGNAAITPESAYGQSYSHSVRKITGEVADVVGDNITKMSDDPGCMLAIHELGGASTAPSCNSVFGTREAHFMFEFIGGALNIENRENSVAWAKNTWEDIGRTESSNLLPGAYISLDRPSLERGTVPLSRSYGLNCGDVLDLKTEYDPRDVFSYAVPQLKNYL